MTSLNLVGTPLKECHLDVLALWLTNLSVWFSKQAGELLEVSKAHPQLFQYWTYFSIGVQLLVEPLPILFPNVSGNTFSLGQTSFWFRVPGLVDVEVAAWEDAWQLMMSVNWLQVLSRWWCPAALMFWPLPSDWSLFIPGMIDSNLKNCNRHYRNAVF